MHKGMNHCVPAEVEPHPIPIRKELTDLLYTQWGDLTDICYPWEGEITALQWDWANGNTKITYQVIGVVIPESLSSVILMSVLQSLHEQYPDKEKGVVRASQHGQLNFILAYVETEKA